MGFEEKNILVVGGAGFIGSNLVDRLIKQGHEVIIVDNFSTGKKENVNLHAKVYELSVEDEDLKKVFRREKIDCVYYFASVVNCKDSEEDQIDSINLNIRGFSNLIKNVVEFGIKKVILCSTLQVYGDIDEEITESLHVNPITYNGVISATLENILKVSAKINDFKYCVLRCSSVYGKRQTEFGEGYLIQRYINTLKRGSVPVIVGDEGEPVDCVFISDIVNAHVKALHMGDNETYNIASGDDRNIGDIVDILIKKVNPKVRYIVENGESREVFYSNVNIDKAMKELEWRPVCSAELGLEVVCKEDILHRK